MSKAVVGLCIIFYYLKISLHPGIDSLVRLLVFLKDFNDWRSLGLELGLLSSTLHHTETNYSNVGSRKREMLAAWLSWMDNVDTAAYGKPSWARLQKALKKLNPPLANSMEVNTPWQ